MIIKEDPKLSIEELTLVKVAAWTWYGHGSGFEQTKLSERGKQEAMEDTNENIRASTYYFPKLMLPTKYAGSTLLDAYEIERISKDLDHYIRSSCDQYYRRKFVDVVCDPSDPKTMSSSLKRDCRGTKENKTSKEEKWFGFRVIYKLCGSIEGGVVEKVQLPALEKRQVNYIMKARE